MATFVLDAVIFSSPGSSFKLDALILGDRVRHHRVRDHYGQDLTSFVVIDSAIGGYQARSTIQDVISDLYARITALDSFNHHVATFAFDAYILGLGGVSGTGTLTGALALSSAIKGTLAAGFSLDAVLSRGGSFALDALVVGGRSFTLYAILV